MFGMFIRCERSQKCSKNDAGFSLPHVVILNEVKDLHKFLYSEVARFSQHSGSLGLCGCFSASWRINMTIVFFRNDVYETFKVS